MGVYSWLCLIVDITSADDDDGHHQDVVMRVVDLDAIRTQQHTITTRRNALPPEGDEGENFNGILSQASVIIMDKNVRLPLPLLFDRVFLSDVDVNLKCCVQNVVSPGRTYNNNIGSGDSAPRSA